MPIRAGIKGLNTKTPDKPGGRRSLAWRDDDLRRGAPDSFRQAQSTRPVFDRVRDPLIKAQLEAMRKPEIERRGEQGSGSQMVKLQKPFPELRPHNAGGVKRSAFNRAWADEIRRSRLAEFREETREPDKRSPWTRRTGERTQGYER